MHNLDERARRRFRRALAIVSTLALASVGLLLAPQSAPAATSTTRYHGSTPFRALNKPVVGFAPAPSGKGYWLVASDGGVFSFGSAKFHGSTGSLRLKKPIVGMAARLQGGGYWLVAADGGIFTFGTSKFFGSTGAKRLNQPIVGMAARPQGDGYWLVAADGGIFTFGRADYKGSLGGRRLSARAVGIAPTRDGRGYWIALSNGAVYSFGSARGHGSMAGRSIPAPIVSIAPASNGNGYLLAGRNGSVYAFGTASHGSAAGFAAYQPTVGIGSGVDGGYWTATRNGAVHTFNSAGFRPDHYLRPSTTALKIAQSVFSRMNGERRARGLSRLVWDVPLQRAATSWSSQLAATRSFQHQDLSRIMNGPAGANRFVWMGENLYAGTGNWADVGSAHISLMKSAHHRANMLDGRAHVVGVGVVCYRGTLYVTEDFATPHGSPIPTGAVPSLAPIVHGDTGGSGC